MSQKCNNECKLDEKEWCMKLHDGYQCTRKKGHTGNHIACGSMEHEFDEWEQDEKPKDK